MGIIGDCGRGQGHETCPAVFPLSVSIILTSGSTTMSRRCVRTTAGFSPSGASFLAWRILRMSVLAPRLRPRANLRRMRAGRIFTNASIFMSSKRSSSIPRYWNFLNERLRPVVCKREGKGEGEEGHGEESHTMMILGLERSNTIPRTTERISVCPDDASCNVRTSLVVKKSQKRQGGK